MDPVKWTTTIFFEVVGLQSQSFVVNTWSFSSWSERKLLLSKEEESFLLVSSPLSSLSEMIEWHLCQAKGT